MYALGGKNVFITGGSQGLGKAYTEALLREKCRVAFCDVNESVGRETEKEFANNFGKENVVFFVADVTQSDMFEKAFSDAVSRFGHVDIFINNAGILNEQVWRKMVQINVIGVVQGTHMAVEHMRKDKGGAGGRIVNVSSVAGLGVHFSQPVYVGTKNAVRSFTCSLAMEPGLVEKKGLEIATLCPDAANTDLCNKLDANKIHSYDSVNLFLEARKMPISKPVEAMLQLLRLDQMNGALLQVTNDGRSYRKMVNEDVGTTWPASGAAS